MARRPPKQNVFLLLVTLSITVWNCAEGKQMSFSVRPTSPLGRGVPSDLPKPRPEQLAWSKLEIGALICFEMITYTGGNGQGIHANNLADGNEASMHSSEAASLPNPSIFNPTKLNISQWAEAVNALGAKYAVLVAKHNTGFTLWPSKVSLPQVGFTYNYTIAASPSPSKDIAKDFVDTMRGSGVLPGFYMSLATNEYLNVRSNKVQKGALAPGQANVTQEEYDEIALALLKELWTEYGQLEEVWFDGGFSEDIQHRLAQQLAATQQHAVAFNGYGISVNPIRWIGTEAGHAPADTWSTSNGGYGAGSPNGTFWYPPECDTTLQNHDAWFYNKNVGIRPLSELIQVYHDTVGHNCNLLLAVTPTTEGIIDPQHMAQFQALGDFIRQCYTEAKPVNSTSGQGDTLELVFATPASFDRIIIMEDQSQGQCIRGYNTSIVTANQSTPPEPLSSGHSVGHKKIDLLATPAENATSVQLTITATAAGCKPVIEMFAAYNCHSLMETIVHQE